MRASPEHWQVGPDNRWAYGHVDELLPVAVVRRGAGAPLELPPRPPGDLGGVAFAAGDGTPTTLDAFVDDGFVDGLAIVHEGALVHERYGGVTHEATLHLSQSVAKSVLGLLCGVLCGRGLLDPAEPVVARVPEVAGSGYDGATVRHLLDMTAAVDFAEDYEADFWRYDVACGWHPPVPGADARSILAFLPTIGPAGWTHGERLHYVTPNTDLLGIVVERAGGAPLAELLSRELWGPLGAERDAQLTLDPAGTAAIGGGLCATLRDYVRVGALVLDEGRDVVPEAWVRGLGRGDPRAVARATDPRVLSGADGYAAQWWRRDARPLARGIHGQLIAVDPAVRVVVGVLSSWPTATDPVLEAAHRALVDAVCARLRRAPA